MGLLLNLRRIRGLESTTLCCFSLHFYQKSLNLTGYRYIKINGDTHAHILQSILKVGEAKGLTVGSEVAASPHSSTAPACPGADGRNTHKPGDVKSNALMSVVDIVLITWAWGNLAVALKHSSLSGLWMAQCSLRSAGICKLLGRNGTGVQWYPPPPHTPPTYQVHYPTVILSSAYSILTIQPSV